MKATKILMGLAILVSSFAQAEAKPNEIGTLTRYVTHGGCRVYTDREDLDRETPGNQTYEIWLYLNKVPGPYNPNADLSGNFFLEDNREARRICQQIHAAYKSKMPITFIIDFERSLKYERQVQIVGLLNESAPPFKSIDNFSAGK